MATLADAPRHIGVQARTAIVAILATLGTAVVIGIPTDVLPNPWFERQVGVRPADVVVLIALSVVTGALASTYVVAGGSGPSAPRAGFGSGLIGWFAVGCPVCNKLVVALLGVSGATSKFEPAQPFLGALAVALAVTALGVRLRAMRRGACALPRRTADERT